MNRRNALTALAVTGAAATLSPQAAAKKETPKLGSPQKMRVSPLPFDPTKLPGLSERLTRSHHEKNYTGAVRKLNAVRAQLKTVDATAPGFVTGALKAKELAFANSVTLHELYFSNLGGQGRAKKPNGSLAAALSMWFGSVGTFEQEIRALGGALSGGSGWVILSYDLHSAGLALSPSSGHAEGRAATLPLLVLDMYEHSYHQDYGANANAYVDAFWKNLNWAEVGRRFKRAQAF